MQEVKIHMEIRMDSELNMIMRGIYTSDFFRRRKKMVLAFYIKIKMNRIGDFLKMIK